MFYDCADIVATLNQHRGHLLRSIPFLMSGHLNFKFFQALGTPLFNTNLNNGCPNMIYQHSGQAHKHFSHRFHGRSFLADVQTWELKLKFVFSATNLPHCQNLKTQRIKIITSMCQITLRDSSDHFYPPTGHVRPWDFVQPWDLVQAWYYCPYFMKIATETQFQYTNINHWWFEAKWV